MIYVCKTHFFRLIFQAIWPYSGHYLPTEENFREFISFLEENHVDLTDVKVYLHIQFVCIKYLYILCSIWILITTFNAEMFG